MKTELFWRNGFEGSDVFSVPLPYGVMSETPQEIDTAILDRPRRSRRKLPQLKRPLTLLMKVNLSRAELKAIRELRAVIPCLVGLSDSDERPQVSKRGRWKLPKERTMFEFVAVVQEVSRYELRLMMPGPTEVHWGQ